MTPVSLNGLSNRTLVLVWHLPQDPARGAAKGPAQSVAWGRYCVSLVATKLFLMTAECM